jgi:hypothetical protein
LVALAVFTIVILGLAGFAISYIVLSTLIEGAVRRAVRLALRDHHQWLNSQKVDH